MKQEPGAQEPKVNIAGYLWLLALVIGIAIGAAIANIGAGIGMGMAVSIVGVIIAQFVFITK